MEEEIYYTPEECEKMIKESIRENAKKVAREIININKQYAKY